MKWRKKGLLAAVPLGALVGIVSTCTNCCNIVSPINQGETKTEIRLEINTRKIEENLNTKASENFIQYFCEKYVMEVKDISTDIADSIKDGGLEATVDKYVQLHHLYLDFAVRNPRSENLPVEELKKIGMASYDHVRSNAQTSKLFIDYQNEDLKEGVIDAYSKCSAYWVKLHQGLLRSQKEKTDFKEAIRDTFTKEQYSEIIEEALAEVGEFYDALKLGTPKFNFLVRGKLNKIFKRTQQVYRSTIDDIYRG